MEAAFDDVIRRAQRFPISKEGLEGLYLDLAGEHGLALTSELSGARNGFLITFDGHSGAGKDTQIELLSRRIKAELPGIDCEILQLKRSNVFHPATKHYWLYPERFPGPEAGFSLNACGRRNTVFSCLLPLLKEGAIVIMNRSALSPAAYRAHGVQEAEELLEMTASWEPKPDIAFILECDTDTAFERITQRAPQKGGIIYNNETPPFIERSKRIFAGLAKSRQEACLINTDAGREEVAGQIWTHVKEVLGVWKR